MSSTGRGELRGDPGIQYFGLMLYDQSNTTRTQNHPQSTPIQEGAVLGQAHHYPDGTDQDCLASINEARQPVDITASVYGQHMQDGQPPTTQGGHQDRYQRFVQLAPASSSHHADYRSHDSPQQSTGNHQPFIVNLPPQQPTVAYQHVSSTHEALTRGLYTQMGHSVYTNHWNFCFNSMTFAGHDQATAEAFANNMLYYPDGRPVLKCLLCHYEHDEGSLFGHAAACIVRQCLISMTMNHDIQAISPRCRLAEGRSQPYIDSNWNDDVTAIQSTIDPSSLQNPAAASDISPPQTPGCKKIQYPMYADPQDRIRSFDKWPTSKLLPKRLATAGFYYTGTSDHCRCFYCGGVLRAWEDSDDPMKKHQHCFPDCPFVLDAKNVACNTRTSTDKGVTNVKERNRRRIEAIEDGVTKLSLQERAANIPPELDVNICGVCNRNEIAVSQYHCGHIVCRECKPRKDSKGNFLCRICRKEVTMVVAIDRSAFKN